MIIILKDLFLKVVILFLDNIRVKGPYSDYDNELRLLGIRRFVFKYLQNLNVTLDRIKRVGAYVRPKSQFCYNRIEIIGFVCRSSR